jgi:DNA-binding CsgD family transcriptional regulator
MSPEAVKHRIFEALRWLVCESAARRPLVLAFEDLHWVDKTTEEFVTFLLEHLAASRVLLVCTYRLEFVCTWSRKSYHNVITLPHLGHAEGYQMLMAMLGTDHVHDDLATFILDKAEGVPFFLEELVKSLLETRSIERQEDQWRLTAKASVMPVPDTVEEVLMARIDRLPEGAKSVLQIGAVMGREFGWELLREVMGLLEQELMVHAAALADAELLYARGLPPQITYLFKHTFTQEAAYHSLLTTRRRELHHRVAVTLEALFPDRLEEVYGQLAHHYFEAGEEDGVNKALEYAMRAGDRDMALSAYAEAARFYHMALEALERQGPVDEASRVTLLLALGESYMKAGDEPQAMETFQRAAECAKVQGSPEALARAALGFAEADWRPGLPGGSPIRLLEEALGVLGEEDSSLKARVLGALTRALIYTGSLERATVIGQHAVHMAHRVGDLATLAYTLRASLSTWWRPQNIAEKLATATEVMRLAEAVVDRDLALEASSWRLFDLMELGDMQAVEAQLAAQTQLAEELRLPFYQYISRSFRAMWAIFAGRFAEGERLSRQALALGQHLPGQDTAGLFSLQMFTLRREQGHLPEVASVVRHVVQTSPPGAVWRPGLAMIYSELGRTREAREEFEHLATDNFTTIPQDALWIACMVYLAEVCTFLGDARRAATLYQCFTPYEGYNILVGPTAVSYGAAARYLGMLAATMVRWEDAQRHFEDALAMNARMGARPWLAHTQYQYAIMFLTRSQPGDGEQATSLLDKALITARELGMPALEKRLIARLEQRPPPVPTALDTLDDLSQREVEVLRLLATGKSNRDIADALCISSSTVASHVRHILSKTGCANRTEAAAYALRHGLTEH